MLSTRVGDRAIAVMPPRICFRKSNTEVLHISLIEQVEILLYLMHILNCYISPELNPAVCTKKKQAAKSQPMLTFRFVVDPQHFSNKRSFPPGVGDSNNYHAATTRHDEPAGHADRPRVQHPHPGNLPSSSGTAPRAAALLDLHNTIRKRPAIQPPTITSSGIPARPAPAVRRRRRCPWAQRNPRPESVDRRRKQGDQPAQPPRQPPRWPPPP